MEFVSLQEVRFPKSNQSQLYIGGEIDHFMEILKFPQKLLYQGFKKAKSLEFTAKMF